MASTSSAPYFAQWESPELIADILLGAKTAADDPLWHRSGASTLDEYAHWAGHLCGMACFKMAIAALLGREETLLGLARGAVGAGGYVVDGEQIRGLIYAPALAFLAQSYGIDGQVRTGLQASDLQDILDAAPFFVASVHHTVRWPQSQPPQRGGHLVLVTAADAYTVTFHNPSGDRPENQADAALPLDSFDRFFAGRGMTIFKPRASTRL